MIYVIGLGTGSGSLSERAIKIIKNCGAVVVKTDKSAAYDAVKGSGILAVTLDRVYESSRNFDTLNKNLSAEVLKISKNAADTAYIVDGAGYDDISVKLLFQKTKNITVIPNVPKSDALKFCPSPSYTVFSAYDFAYQKYAEFSTQNPLAIYEIDSGFIASELKLSLFKYYPEDTKVIFSDGKSSREIQLFDLDRQNEYNYSSSIVIPPIDLLKKERFTFGDLLHIMARLRGEGGCPWDREQTHDSIKMNAVEEAYELIEAINNGDTEAMAEESGDLLLQTVFQSRIAEDMSEYDINDVISILCKKLLTRHTHIFGSDKASEAAQALVTWEKNKKLEKSQDTYTKSMQGVAKTFPALTRAEKVQKRAAKCGFDFTDLQSVYSKIYEETEELKAAVASEDKEEIKKEAGDLLFSAVNLLRKLGVDCELALNDSTDKFIKRFSYMEEKLTADGKELSDCTLDEMEQYYIQSKNNEK